MLNEKILIIEDDPGIVSFVSMVLQSNNYEVLSAATAAEALSLFNSHCPELVLLDLGLPDMDGMNVLKKIRSYSEVPVLVVSARTEESDKVLALDSGADDYIIKPFGTQELMARIRSALRHSRIMNSNPDAVKKGRFEHGSLMIDFENRKVTVNGEAVHLTQNEYRLVAILAKNAGRVMTYDSLLTELWGPASTGDNQILRVNMANIRRKIETNPASPEHILTEIGVGYRMMY